MLILSRNVTQSIIIGDNITVTVLAVHGNQIKLGIEAPKNIRVDREEVRARIEAENRNG